MDLAGRLWRIQQEIVQVENEKRHNEYTLGLFWEHMPCIDPIIIRDRMLALTRQIKALEARLKGLHQKESETLVLVAINRQASTSGEKEEEEQEKEKEEEKEGEAGTSY